MTPCRKMKIMDGFVIECEFTQIHLCLTRRNWVYVCGSWWLHAGCCTGAFCDAISEFGAERT